MFTQGFAEILTDVMTTNPSLSGIPSASAILDTSNYTFAALSLGKDAEGFKYHAHRIESSSAGLYNSGILLVKIYNTVSPSSYHSSATHNLFSATYNSLPCYPSITDTRLERGSTISNVSSIDMGHYINAAIDTDLSSSWNVIGGYPPSGNTARYMLVNSSGEFITSGFLSGSFNNLGIVDRFGFISIDPLRLPAGGSPGVAFSAGPYVTTQSSISSTGEVSINMLLKQGDAATIAAFGGLTNFGIWSVNLKELLRSGLNPPYNLRSINNSRKYKLVAKATMWKDLMKHDDELFSSSSGFEVILATGFVLTFSGPTYTLKVRFI